MIPSRRCRFHALFYPSMLYSKYPSYSDYFDGVVSGDVCSALKDFLKKKKKREEWEEEGRRKREGEGGGIVGGWRRVGGKESGRQGIETCQYIRFERGRLHVLAPQAADPYHRSP